MRTNGIKIAFISTLLVSGLISPSLFAGSKDADNNKINAAIQAVQQAHLLVAALFCVNDYALLPHLSGEHPALT